jgi:hypothetical protein
LAAEHEEDLDFAGGPDEGCVDNAEALGDEGEPSAKVGDGITWILGVSATFWKQERGHT